MSDPTDLSTWDEITVRTPGWKATPDQVADFLRAVFPEDVILAHQQRIAEGALREATGEFKRVAERKTAADPKHGETTMNIILTVLSHFDPDHREWGGFFPSKLLCPHHDTATRPPFGVRTVMAHCPGVPRCRAGSGIREARR